MTEWLIFLMAGIKYIISISLSTKWRQENVDKQPLENKLPCREENGQKKYQFSW